MGCCQVALPSCRVAALSYSVEDVVDYNNADEVMAFIKDHKGQQWQVGDRLVLPDIEQPYSVVQVRPFKTGKKFYLYVDLESACAVGGCGEPFIVSKEVHEWMASPYLTRCCPDHRGAFQTPMKDAWLTPDRRAKRDAKAAERAVRKAAKVPVERLGRVEQIVLDAAEALTLVREDVGLEDVVAFAAMLMPKPDGRDVRKQVCMRAAKSLAKRGRVVALR